MRRRSTSWRVGVIGLLAGAFVWAPAWAAENATAQTRGLSEEIHRLVAAPCLERIKVGVWIERLAPNREVLFEQLSDHLFKPASTMKLVTTSAALTTLPAKFAYRTILARHGDNLVVIGSGDPSIGDPVMARAANESITAVFHRWAKAMKAAGITAIHGDLIFDDFCFEQQYIHPHWVEQFKSQMQKWYVAPVGGLNFNDNCVDVVIKPDRKLGLPAPVTLIPNTPWVRLDNKSKTTTKGEPLVRRLGTGPITISVSGPVSRPNSREHPLSVSVVDPGAFFTSTLRTVLAIHDIKIDGENRRQRIRLPNGQLPERLKVIAIHETRLSDLLWRVNKSSQNLFGEAIFKSLGFYAAADNTIADSMMRIGSYATGRQVIARYLETIGISRNHYVLDDGSGLSHSNRVTPAMMAMILRFMDLHPRRQMWLESLAQPGEEVGTLKRRMPDLKGNVFAKTGHVRGVSALCGYVFGPADRRYAFVILCNDTHITKGGGRAAHKLQEAVCKTLATWEPEPVVIGG